MSIISESFHQGVGFVPQQLGYFYLFIMLGFFYLANDCLASGPRALAVQRVHQVTTMFPLRNTFPIQRVRLSGQRSSVGSPPQPLLLLLPALPIMSWSGTPCETDGPVAMETRELLVLGVWGLGGGAQAGR